MERKSPKVSIIIKHVYFYLLLFSEIFQEPSFRFIGAVLNLILSPALRPPK